MGKIPGRSAPAEFSEAPLIVYFSSVSENTHRFVEKLGLRARRIPLIDHDGSFTVDEPYVLICPTYGGGKTSGGHGAEGGAGPVKSAGGFVPKQVIRFLNNPHNRSLITAVIAAGNTNFGEEFCFAGDIISRKCQVPYLYRFELMGDTEDVERVQTGLHHFAQRSSAPDQTAPDHAQESSQCRQPQPQ
ncbi:class Ib ribonucleoside-diphosphate reductase assembly flavoprotein NrdI [Williamsia soli]|uniref:class Ib ribonucleoside-diphosphate reductase assembly flavoprotein NrdI n=1 Tax=Williamsia soli TaxID=364929 RepID=UPI001A9DE950|nr:class Ib ribonucleoside-diphosphate reductase assembly flavoprotein NrdI [Williamsia soli]